MAASGPRRGRPRSREETAAERQARKEKTVREIQELAAEFHARLPRDQAVTVGAIYVRYSTRFQDSVADQVRALLEIALKKKIYITIEFIFFDLAIRGAKSHREGLDTLRAVLARKAVNVLLIFGTNRLFRKTYKALQFIEEEVVERGIRCLFAKSGIDTADEKRWRATLHLHAVLDELGSGMHAENIRAAQEGLFVRLLVYGTVSFGYTGEPLPGEFTRRKLPRRRLMVDPEEARWVLQIFTWLVQDRLPIGEIIRLLNAEPGIPLPPKCITGMWTRQAVLTVLTNARYRGWWEYGKTQTVWQAKKDYARQVPRDQPLREAQIEELRIIPDELWYAAQKRLQELGETAVGRRPKDGDRKSRPRLLNGLFWCPEHSRRLYVGGPNGTQMFCPACKATLADQRPLFSHLNRARALKLTCEKLADLVQPDDELIGQIITACQQEVARSQQGDPHRLAELRRRDQALTGRIKFVMANVGDSEADQRESAEELRRLRRERAAIEADIARLVSDAGRPSHVPSAAEVRTLLEELGGILAAAAGGESVEEVETAREIVKLLTGGRIELYQQGERKAQHGWLQGRFRVWLLPYLVGKAAGGQGGVCDDQGIEVTIDYREPAEIDGEAEPAKELYDQERMNCQIAAALGCGRNWVTKLLRHWFELRGLEMPDGRKRRKSLRRKQVDAPLYEQLADAAKALCDEGLADVQIAERLGCSPPTAVAAVDHWHAVRGLVMPSHAERRPALVDRMLSLYDARCFIRAIAREVGMCTRSVTLLLRERLKSLGRPMVDGRTRRAKLECDSRESGVSQVERQSQHPPPRDEGLSSLM